MDGLGGVLGVNAMRFDNMQSPLCNYDEPEELLECTSFDTRFYVVQSTALLANHA